MTPEDKLIWLLIKLGIKDIPFRFYAQVVLRKSMEEALKQQRILRNLS